MLPCVDTGKERVDPLRDRRVAEVLKKQGMEHCFVNPWTFGQEGEEEQKLKNAWGITTNSHGQFIITDSGDETLKVFDSNGIFDLSFNPQTDDTDTFLHIFDVATDVKSNIYVLITLNKPEQESKLEVQVYNDTAGLVHKFPVRYEYWEFRLTVSGSKVLVLRCFVVDVYEQNGEFLLTFGEGELKDSTDITALNDGRVMVMDNGDFCVHLFTVEGQQLYKFNINIEGDDYHRIACHPAGEHVVVAGYGRATCWTGGLRVAIFTISGELVRRIQLDEEKAYEIGLRRIRGITVTMEGHIAVALKKANLDPKVTVI